MEEVSVSYLVPVYNNAATLVSLVQQLEKVSAEQHWGYEIIFVDDCSTDDSLEVLRSLGTQSHVNVYHLVSNQGQSVALMAAIQFVKCRYAVALDADFQDNPTNIPLLINRLKEQETDVVFGGRIGTYQHKTRHVTSRIFKYMIYLLSHTKIPVSAGLFFAIKKDAALQLTQYAVSKPYLLSLMARQKLRAVSVPVMRQHNAGGQSGYSFLKRIKVGLKGVLFFYHIKPGPLPALLIQQVA